MGALLRFSAVVDAISTFIGRSVSWLILVAVLVSAGNATIRKVFDTSSNAWLELQWYLYGAVFLLAASYTLLRNEHVRIDVATTAFSRRTRQWIDLLGHIFFLMPFVIIMMWVAWPYFWVSFTSGEISVNASGLILWPAKFLVFAGFFLLFFQTLSEIIKRFAVIGGVIDDPLIEHELPPMIEEMETAADLEERMTHK